MSDIERIHAALRTLEAEADTLTWAKSRPWRVETHVFAQGALPVVDLHDLNAKLARQAVRAVLEFAEELEAGAVRFVVGRGRHSMGPGGTLGKVVRKLLKRAVAERDWRFRSDAATLTLIVDPAKAPAAATGDLGLGFWLMMGGFAMAAGYVAGARLGLW
jgi:hypothetical protein